jgi:hypothetical protein
MKVDCLMPYEDPMIFFSSGKSIILNSLADFGDEWGFGELANFLSC